jgi:hypothetical protein
MRRLVWTIVLLLNTAAVASADCVSDIRDALKKLRTSGQFHFVSQQWNKNFLRQTAGRIDPGRAQHDTINVEDGWRGDEVIFIGSQSWRNDGLGWQGPWSTLWTHGLVIPDEALKVADQKCTITETTEGPQIKRYDFGSLATPDLSHTLLINADNGTIIRYEKVDNSKNGVNLISTYRHDPTIRIEPPIVDMKKRTGNALAAFENAVALAKEDCRNAVIKLLEIGLETLPFKYKIEGYLWSGVSGMHGTFVPPHSIHNVVDGVPPHGGGSEHISIGGESWVKTAFKDWTKTNAPSFLEGAVSAGWSGSLFFDDFLVNNKNYIGNARCPGMGQEAPNQVEFYEYEIYRDTPSGRMLVANQRMHVGRNGLPEKLETVRKNGAVTQVQIRSYMPGLKIEAPNTQ